MFPSIFRFTRWLLPFALLPLVGCGRTDYSDQETDHLLDSAARYISTFSFFEAEGRLRALRERTSPGSENWQESTFLLALTLRHQTPSNARLIDEARALLEELVATSPDSPLAPDALMALARIAALRNYPGDEQDNETAAALYRRLLEEYPESELRDLAALRLADIQLTDFTDPEMVAAANASILQYIEENPDSPNLGMLWNFVAQNHLLILQDEAAALPALIEADRHSLTAPGRRGDNFWLIAQIAEGQGDLETARTYYRKLIDEAPRSLIRTEASARYEALSSAKEPSTSTPAHSNSEPVAAPRPEPDPLAPPAEEPPSGPVLPLPTPDLP